MSESTRETLIASLRAASPEHADSLIPLIRSSINIGATVTPDEEIPIGASKFGGAPDVPADFEWPLYNGQPVFFIAQFNLEELAPLDVESRLPDRGQLSFFFDYEAWAEDSVPKVIWFPDGVAQRLPLPPGHELVIPPPPVGFLAKLKSLFSLNPNMAPPIPSCRLTFEQQWQLPPDDSPEFEFDPLKEAGFSRDVGEIDDVRGGHCLLGYPDSVQNDVRTEVCIPPAPDPRRYTAHIETHLEDAEREALDWQLLFQQNSDDHWLWGDVGSIYYLIHREDLAARRFDQVRIWVQSH